jgi:hypothetical protein
MKNMCYFKVGQSLFPSIPHIHPSQCRSQLRLQHGTRTCQSQPVSHLLKSIIGRRHHLSFSPIFFGHPLSLKVKKKEKEEADFTDKHLFLQFQLTDFFPPQCLPWQQLSSSAFASQIGQIHTTNPPPAPAGWLFDWLVSAAAFAPHNFT